MHQLVGHVLSDVTTLEVHSGLDSVDVTTLEVPSTLKCTLTIAHITMTYVQ